MVRFRANPRVTAFKDSDGNPIVVPPHKTVAWVANPYARPKDERDELLTRPDLIELIHSLPSVKTHIRAKEILHILSAFLGSLESDCRIRLRGFGTFTSKQYDPGVVTNPRTGEKKKGEPRQRITFKPSRELLDGLNP
ncbi:HU family DNA-binding protein [Ferrimonas balearica]|uniref:HU family DNA-binding protein n=1 Tax=Ferrimonas balearica TaxID=44012 RepID=UPI001C95584A|nr:HU family DNA-binding protein [Ferrimonas balearica]MBY6105008.1 HU family DNA-binding protein [Ferrimonas balearica]